MRFSVCALACLGVLAAEPLRAQGSQPPFDMEFQVTEFQREPVASDVIQTITLGEDGTVHGKSGCNTYSAGYATIDTAIMIQPVRVTNLECPRDQMSAESRFFAILTAVVSYEYDFETETLALYGVSGPPVMRLKPVKP